MKHNVGKADRAFRAVAGIVVMATGFFLQSYWGALGLILLATSAMSYCPLYTIFGFSSCPLSKNGSEKDIIT